MDRISSSREIFVRSVLLLLSLLFASLVAAAPAAAVTLGQIDDFQDGTTQGWRDGGVSPNPPVNMSDVGPAGVGDHSLQITSTGGFGAGSRFVAFNTAQWTGDYPTAGVDMITFDVNNIGSANMDLRVALDGVGGRFVTTASMPVAAGSGWQSIEIPIGPAHLTSVGGLDVNATLSAVTQLRVISAVSPSFLGDPILAQGLIDNVTAAGPVSAPVPSANPLSIAMLLSLLGLVSYWKLRA